MGFPCQNRLQELLICNVTLTAEDFHTQWHLSMPAMADIEEHSQTQPLRLNQTSSAQRSLATWIENFLHQPAQYQAEVAP
jgi:hypothetical protein